MHTHTLINKLASDEAGFIISSELILVATIGVIGVIVGLAEVTWNVNQELEDVGSAIGSVNQSFSYKGYCGPKGRSVGSQFQDSQDQGDSECDITCESGPQAERKGNH